MSRASRSKVMASPKTSWATRVTSAASRPPVTASGMFQRRNGAIQRFSPAPTKKTMIEIVKVRKPGVSIVVVIGPGKINLVNRGFLNTEPCHVERRQKNQRDNRSRQETAHDRIGHGTPEDGRRNRDQPQNSRYRRQHDGTEAG